MWLPGFLYNDLYVGVADVRSCSSFPICGSVHGLSRGTSWYWLSAPQLAELHVDGLLMPNGM
jgi:hypothetical protein